MFMACLRLLPGGLALIGWAAASGRPQPSTPLAWAWVAAFALVDGAMFQVGGGRQLWWFEGGAVAVAVDLLTSGRAAAVAGDRLLIVTWTPGGRQL